MALKYSEKLKDPRWQRKRLEIFTRDGWMCKSCGDSEATLCVHHRQYIRGVEPWDYANDMLVTLCEGCHAEERELRWQMEAQLLDILRKTVFWHDLNSLADALSSAHPGQTMEDMLETAIISLRHEAEWIREHQNTI